MAEQAALQNQADMQQMQAQMEAMQAQQAQMAAQQAGPAGAARGPGARSCPRSGSGAAAAAAAAPDFMAQLQQLAQLKESGVLSDEEFQAAKAKLLAS